MKEKKSFLISIDTEGDDLWSWTPGKEITTRNAQYLQRFQALCDRYDFKPTYLTNYEMATDEGFVSFGRKTLGYGGCEIGMHLHAWNSPPEHALAERTDGVQSGCSYLIEYPAKVMEEKICYMTELLKKQFGVKPITHRAGRWAMNQTYFQLLEKYGYQIDCSVTPGKEWRSAPGFTNGSQGSDYLDAPLEPYRVPDTQILEIPMTVRESHRVKKDDVKTVRHALGNYYRAMKGHGKIWLRPNGRNLEDLLYLTDLIEKQTTDYLMFMLHSSEFMPGGSWTFDTEEKIEKLYSDLGVLFQRIAKGFEGITIGDYGAKLNYDR